VERPGLAYLLIVAAIVLLAIARVMLGRNRRLDGWFAFLHKVEVGVITLLLFALVFFGCLQIVLRNFFHSGLVWADPMMRHIVLWLGCLGGVMATSKMRHINIDVLSRLLPERFKSVRARVVNLATAVASSVLGLAALKLVIDERAFGEKDFLNIDIWVLQLILPIAFFTISYRSLCNVLTAKREKAVHWEADLEAGGESKPVTEP
jgi:TRAP-type C4-dicarboxylate transport system permease small subunit